MSPISGGAVQPRVAQHPVALQAGALGDVVGIASAHAPGRVFTVIFGRIARVAIGGRAVSGVRAGGTAPMESVRESRFGRIAVARHEPAHHHQAVFSSHLSGAGSGGIRVHGCCCRRLLLAVLMIVYGVRTDAGLTLADSVHFSGSRCSRMDSAALLPPINARWRDVQHTVPFLLQIGHVCNARDVPAARRARALAVGHRAQSAGRVVGVFRSSALGRHMPAVDVLVTIVRGERRDRCARSAGTSPAPNARSWTWYEPR